MYTCFKRYVFTSLFLPQRQQINSFRIALSNSTMIQSLMTRLLRTSIIANTTWIKIVSSSIIKPKGSSRFCSSLSSNGLTMSMRTTEVRIYRLPLQLPIFNCLIYHTMVCLCERKDGLEVFPIR